jgi:ribonuclease HI
MTEQPHFIKVYVDGGTLMAGRHTKVTRGVYWSICVEDGQKEPHYIRRQDEHYKTNNDAEWLAMKEGIRYVAEHHKDQPIVIYSDSMLVVKQFNGEWQSKIARHHRMRTECLALAKDCRFVAVQWVPRKVNVEKLGH